MTSTMAHNLRNPNGRAAKVFAALLALLVWEGAARLVHNKLLLVGPWTVVCRLFVLMQSPAFWEAAGFTFGRITFGFVLAFCLAAVLSVLSYRFALVQTLLRPYMLAVQTIPVASFIVIALLWLSSRRLSVFIAFLMVLPVLYANCLQGLQSADRKLLELARVYRMPLYRKVRCIYLPAMEPYVLAACRTALGMCWKAGVAAEVIGVTGHSVGGMLYDAKVYLEIADLFAWTLVIVLVSGCFEQVFLWMLKRVFGKLEGIA